MSELIYLEKLLDGAEVEWKALEDVTSVLRGKRLTKNLLSAEEKFPVFHGGLEPLGYYNKSNRPANTVMIINVGASAGTVGYSAVDFWSSDGCFCLEHNKLLNNRFLYFALIGYQNLLKSRVRVAGIPTLDAIVVNKLLIPIPCPNDMGKSLAIQSEIVRILDTFTALTTELTTELTMRKKQYNYYRDQLLSFDDGEVEWKTLGDIGHFTYGYAAKAQDVGDARFVRITDINTNGKLSQQKPMFVDINKENEKYILEKDDLLMARTGATFGKTMIFNESYPAIYAGFLIKLSLNKKIINPKYYWHFAQSDFFWEQANKLVSGGGQPQFNANALKQVKLPVPYPTDAQKSLEKQAQIVELLDKFDSIASSVTEGLPREIELRQKQYEYYRDMLFSFPPPEVAEV